MTIHILKEQDGNLTNDIPVSAKQIEITIMLSVEK